MRTFTKQELDKILENHKLWLSSGGEKGERADLSDADLSSANLHSANLSYADLRSAKLRHADLYSADLSYAKLRSADLSYANLSYANLNYADLRSADLYSADLRFANLYSANLRSANLDFSAFPLWCGGLEVNIDDKIAIQLLYHFVSNVKSSPYTSKQLKSLCNMKSIIKQANKFHRADECGIIKED